VIGASAAGLAENSAPEPPAAAPGFFCGRFVNRLPVLAARFWSWAREARYPRLARITLATWDRALDGNSARISVSPVWCRRRPGMAKSFLKSFGHGQVVAVVIFDPAALATDDRPSFHIELEPAAGRHRTEFLCGLELLFRPHH
jgi:hypothetical protein